MGCCDSSTTTGNGCCSIHGAVPSGLGVRWDSKGVTGTSGGALVPAYQADGVSSPQLTINASQRFWIAHLSIVVVTGGVTASVYRGTAAGDHTQANKIILGGPAGANSGYIATLPWIRLAAGEQLYVITPADDGVQVTGYGILETITS